MHFATPDNRTAGGHLRWFGWMLVGLSLAGPCLAAEPENSVIVFGGDAGHPPFKWRHEGNAVGLNVDLQDAVAEVGGVQSEHKLGDWSDVIRELKSGTIDVVAMFKSEARERDFQFTKSIGFVHHAIYGAFDAPNVRSVDDLSSARVSVENLSWAHDRLTETNTTATLVLVPSTRAALEAILDDRADYAILAEPSADYLIQSRQLAVHPVGPPLWPAEYAFAVRKDRAELARWLDEQLDIVVESGRYRDIRARWEDRSVPLRASRVSSWSQYIVLPLIAAVLLGGWWVWSLRRSLGDRAYRLVNESRLRKIAESKLDWAKGHDFDTQMPRQHRFTEQAARLLAQSDPQSRKQVVALKLADLDRTIRAYGHAAGLDAMRQFARRIHNAGFPAYGQMGRDVFVIFGDKTQLDTEFRSLVFAGDTVSMRAPAPRVFAGVATWPLHGDTLPELLRKAESALARAIERRTGWVDFRPFMEPGEEDLRLVSLFRDRGGEAIQPVFQPQIELATGKVIGAEALARWDVPGIGPVSPAVFIPLLDDVGLIRHVTNRMIGEAVRVSAGLRKSGYPCPISVNVTGNDLLGWKLTRSIFKALRKHDGVATDLRLELTETNVIERPEILQWKMRRLVREGIDISVDDFGTGYSSLAYLSDFPVREIKIDQSFVRDMMQNKKDMSIVTSTIFMGHELGLIVIAEGVETEASLNALRRHGCDRAQGFVISRPLTEADFTEFVTSRASPVVTKTSDGKVTRLRNPRR